VPWMDDRGEVHVNRGFRIEMNVDYNALSAVI